VSIGSLSSAGSLGPVRVLARIRLLLRFIRADQDVHAHDRRRRSGCVRVLVLSAKHPAPLTRSARSGRKGGTEIRHKLFEIEAALVSGLHPLLLGLAGVSAQLQVAAPRMLTDLGLCIGFRLQHQSKTSIFRCPCQRRLFLVHLERTRVDSLSLSLSRLVPHGMMYV
jgi:hypothetical protein